MNIRKRVVSPLPNFFKVLRNLGLLLVATGGGILTAPVDLPDAFVAVGGYLIVAGSVASAVSQLTTINEYGNECK
jgi:hypothetical protein